MDPLDAYVVIQIASETACLIFEGSVLMKDTF